MVYHTRNRTRNDTPTQGSAFHELVVLPTLAPHLARPYHVPGTDIVYNTEFSSQTQGISTCLTTIHPKLTLCPTDPADVHSDVPEHGTSDIEAGSQEGQVSEPVVGPSSSNSLNAALSMPQWDPVMILQR